MTRESAIEIVIEHPALAALPYWQQIAAVGVPPHVTLLYPWRSAPLDDASLAALRTVVHQCVPFSLTLGRVALFPRGVVYATVEPDAPIRWLIGAIVELFPDTPPYGGEFAWTGPVPHCTLARCKPDQVESVRSEIAETFKAILPITIPITRLPSRKNRTRECGRSRPQSPSGPASSASGQPGTRQNRRRAGHRCACSGSRAPRTARCSRRSGDITANDAAIASRAGCAVVPGVLIHTGPRQYSLG
jgi:2'-5' RNA ligase superfamily